MLRRSLSPSAFALIFTALVLGAGAGMTAEEILQLVPGLQRYARPEPEQFANVASTALTLDQWVQLAKRVNQVFEEDAGLDGAVITSGTDSLEELAYFLHLTVKTVK